MYVNNEVGAVMPVEEIAALVHEKSPKALFHVDAIQAFGKYRIYPKKMGIDLLSVSGHKIHGPKGVGFLYINEKAKIQPQILGGGQQGGMRSGTDNARELQDLALPLWKSTKIWKRMWKTCIVLRSILRRDLKRSGIFVSTVWI